MGHEVELRRPQPRRPRARHRARRPTGVRRVAEAHRSWHTRQIFRGAPRPSAV